MRLPKSRRRPATRRAADDEKERCGSRNRQNRVPPPRPVHRSRRGPRPRLPRLPRRRPSRCRLPCSPEKRSRRNITSRWPQDLSANLGNSASTAEPLAFDYVRLEEKGQSAKTLTHYQNALTGLSGSKPKITRRKIENGTWLDYVQKDETSHRTRSVDVIR